MLGTPIYHGITSWIAALNVTSRSPASLSEPRGIGRRRFVLLQLPQCLLGDFPLRGATKPWGQHTRVLDQNLPWTQGPRMEWEWNDCVFWNILNVWVNLWIYVMKFEIWTCIFLHFPAACSIRLSSICVRYPSTPLASSLPLTPLQLWMQHLSQCKILAAIRTVNGRAASTVNSFEALFESALLRTMSRILTRV